MRDLGVVVLAVALSVACAPSDGRTSAGDVTGFGTTGAGLTGGATTGVATGDPTTGGPTTGEQTTGGDASTTSSSSAGTDATSDPLTGTGSTGKLDMGGPACPPEDICCLEEGQLPPHKLLDAFQLAYPPAAMPKSVAAVQAFMPEAAGHMMAWSDENVGNELVDAANGGVIEANVAAGRALARAAAEAALPVDATLLEAREDPVVIEDLGTPPPCLGVGWAWGSLLFENADKSIGELVYLYIGFCSNGDVEVFYYSDQAVEVCPAPG